MCLPFTCASCACVKQEVYVIICVQNKETLCRRSINNTPPPPPSPPYQVKKLTRLGLRAPPNALFDAQGLPTQDPNSFACHATFGGHKGYGLCVLTELLAAYGGAGLPTLRGCPTPHVWPHPKPETEKSVNCFYFQVIDFFRPRLSCLLIMCTRDPHAAEKVNREREKK